MVNVSEIMNTDVQFTYKQESLFEAAKKMAENGISCLLVTEEGQLNGIITRRDIFEKGVVERRNLDETKVEEIMSSPVTTLNAEATLIAASGVMRNRKIKQIPIVNEQNNPVGIITQTDIVLNINSMVKFDREDPEMEF